jgi:hypothetical protein
MRITLPAMAVFVGACGGLETPVSSVGFVTGRILDAGPGAYAYPLALPDQKVMLAADGSFRIDDVPVGSTAIVLWDGVQRAELAIAEVRPGGELALADRYGSSSVVPELQKMPLAGAVLAAVTPEGGAIASGPSYSFRLTDHVAVVPSSGGVTTVYPLPGGTFDLSALLPGFREGVAPVVVLSGATVAAQVALPIDLGAAAPGCGSAPGCENGLVCDQADGRCYMCTAADSSACANDEVCDAVAGLCKASGAGNADVCSSCGADADCSRGACVIATGATTGYCSLGCAATGDCPAGFYCGATSKRCKAPEGCDAWLRTMGATCLSYERCEDELYGGRCEHPYGEAGYCTAPCRSNTDCRIGTGAASTFTCSGGYCTPP